MGVQDGFGLAGGAGGVQDVERVFGVHHFGGTFPVGDGERQQFVIPVIAARFHRDLVADPFDDDHVLHGRAALEGFIHGALELDDLAVVVTAIQVMTSFDWLSSIRPWSESTEKPPKTTEWIAPILAQASMAKTISGTRPM